MAAEERRLAVLRAIVADYVAHHEPVGSKTLVDRHRLGVSAATIRNDMALLEEDGYIAQPHTSAGRIPTDKGYRLFVDRLSEIKPLSAGERQAIHTFLSEAVDLDDVMQRSVRLLAQITRQVAVVQYPILSKATVRHLELVGLAPQRVLAVVILDTGRVGQRLVELPADLAADDLAVIKDRLGAVVTGTPPGTAAGAVTQVPPALPEDLRGAATAIVTALLDALVEHPGERLVLAGTSHLTGAWVDQPGTVRGVLEALDEQVTLLKLLALVQTTDAVTVSIGEEHDDANLSTSALVSVGYGNREAVMGGLAVVGPTRMDYPGTMAAVRAVARYVGDILSSR